MDTTGDKMPFTKEQWAEQVHAHLSSLRNGFPKTDVPFLVYGTVAGLTFWPLVAAAAHTPAGIPPACHQQMSKLSTL